MTATARHVSKSTRHYPDSNLFVAESATNTHVRLVKWAEWYRNRVRQAYTKDIDAVEKAVGHMHLELERGDELKEIIKQFYLHRRSIEKLADLLDISQFQCVGYLSRAVHHLSKELPKWDSRLC